MTPPRSSFLKHYASSLLLLGAISCGCLLGLIFKEKAVIFKPFGDIFLNLLFTIVVPLVFFYINRCFLGWHSLIRYYRHIYRNSFSLTKRCNNKNNLEYCAYDFMYSFRYKWSIAEWYFWIPYLSTNHCSDHLYPQLYQ